MRKIGTTTAPASLGKNSSVKERNITLRCLATGLEHNVHPNKKLMTSVTTIFANVKNFIGCEKYFDEAIALMLSCTNRELRDMAGRFQHLITVNGLAD